MSEATMIRLLSNLVELQKQTLEELKAQRKLATEQTEAVVNYNDDPKRFKGAFYYEVPEVDFFKGA